MLRVSSAYYNDFAYAIAGNGAQVDYQDPKVQGDNVDGRTALRKSAGEALSVAATPGLPPAIADPMRSWSWHAAKLAVVMGLRADGDTLNNAAAELNKEAEGTEMACANAGATADDQPSSVARKRCWRSRLRRADETSRHHPKAKDYRNQGRVHHNACACK